MKINFDRINELLKGKKGAAGLAGIIYIVAMILTLTPLHERIEYTLYDLRFFFKPKVAAMDELVLINIDDASIAALGQFPWPRNYYTTALEGMMAAGLNRILFDIQFMDYSPALVDRQAMNSVLEKTNSGKRIKSEELLGAVLDNDAVFSRTLKGFGKGWIPYSFAKDKLAYRNLSSEEKKQREKAVKTFTERASIPVPAGRKNEFEKIADRERVDIQYPIPPISSAAKAFGYVDSDFDIDGTTRRVRLIRVFDGRIYFHLSLAAVMDMCGVNPPSIEINPGKNIVVKNAFNPATGVRGDITIPVDQDCALLINWAGDFKSAFRHLPAFALFEYSDISESVANQLALKDMTAGGGERGKLAEEIDELKIKITGEKNPAKKYLLKKEYKAKLAKHDAILDQYIKTAGQELEKIKASQPESASGHEAETSYSDFISAVQIKSGVDALFDSTAVIGLTATGTQDIGITPLANDFMMVGTYPNVINTILSGEYIYKTGVLLNLFLMLILAMGVSIFIQDKSSKVSVIVISAVFIFINTLYTALFAYAGIWLDQLGANSALVLPSTAIIIVKFTGEERQKKFITGAFSKYLSTKVIEQIIKDPESLKLGGESKRITIFFSDIAGFSGISETLSPMELVQLLNEYLSEMTDIIMSNYGTVDKYEGDAIMAFWGAPYNYPDHAYQACLSAVQMHRRLAELRAFWKKEGRHELMVRMGINTGEAVAGNMGSRTRMNYTVMGDSVNLASRLEGANKFYGTYCMASENTVNDVADKFVFRELDIIRVVGKKEPIKVFELLEEKGKLPAGKGELIEKYNEGLALFRDRSWQRARSVFQQALKIDSDDAPSKTYVDRCAEFIKNPPTSKWDGVYTLKSK